MVKSTRVVVKRVIDHSSRTLSDSDNSRLSQWSLISNTPDEWQSMLINFDGGKTTTIKLHCAYDESLVPENSQNDIFTGNADDYINMTWTGGRFDRHHRTDGTAGDSIKYFSITSADVRQKIGQDNNIPVISNQREYNSYLNKICQRLFKDRHPAEQMPVYFYTEIVYLAWFEGDTNVVSSIRNNGLRKRVNAIKIGETGSLYNFYRKMKNLRKNRGVGDLYCVAYGIPLGWWGHDSDFLHFKFVLANLSGEWHKPDPVRRFCFLRGVIWQSEGLRVVILIPSCTIFKCFRSIHSCQLFSIFWNNLNIRR